MPWFACRVFHNFTNLYQFKSLRKFGKYSYAHSCIVPVMILFYLFTRVLDHQFILDSRQFISNGTKNTVKTSLQVLKIIFFQSPLASLQEAPLSSVPKVL